MGESIVLTTERLVLRPFERGDVDAVFAYARHPEWSRYLIAVQRDYERTDAEAFVAACFAADWDLRPVWAITLAGTAVGGINLSVEPQHRRADLGYSIAHEQWGKGYVTEAATAVLDWAFAHRDLARVGATCDARNTGSWRVMEKLGMQREGHFRRYRIHRGERVDELRYGLLREEWEARAPHGR